MVSHKSLNNTRDHIVRDLLSVLDPVLLVLLSTTVVISERAVEEKQGQEERIEVREGVLEKGGNAPAEGSADLEQVVEVTAKITKL